VEVTVSIGIMLLLAGLTLSISTAVVRASDARRTESAMRLLDQAVKEWEITADRSMTWWQYGDPDEYKDKADVRSSTKPVLIITEMLDLMTREPSSRAIIQQIEPDLVYRYRQDDPASWLEGYALNQVNDRFVGSATILDAWGTPIYATHPGRPWRQDDTEANLARDPDGTIRTYNEQDYGVAPNRRVVFVSAGPDGLFGLPGEFAGDLDPQTRSERMADAAKDNLYTMPVTWASY